MLTTATHDTKLGEDVRARINVISELPDEWDARGVALDARQQGHAHGGRRREPAPDRNDEYRFYQTLVGCWPLDLPASTLRRRRSSSSALQAYMLKAVREAKVHTSWLTANQALRRRAEPSSSSACSTGTGGARFLPLMLPFQRWIARRRHGELALAGRREARARPASRTSTRAPSCGTSASSIPTIGGRWTSRCGRRCSRTSTRCSPWIRQRGSSASPELMREWRDGRIKLLTTAVGLRLRRADPELFLDGAYVPLDTEVDRARSSGGLRAGPWRTRGDCRRPEAVRAPLATGRRERPRCRRAARRRQVEDVAVLLPQELARAHVPPRASPARRSSRP